MKVFVAIIATALIVPVVLVVAVALGPVTLGAIAAAGFGLVVFAAWNLLVALGLAGRAIGRAGARGAHHMHHPQAHS